MNVKALLEKLNRLVQEEPAVLEMIVALETFTGDGDAPDLEIARVERNTAFPGNRLYLCAYLRNGYRL